MPDLNTPEQALVCVVEIPKGVRNKYEYDPELGGWRSGQEIVESRERLSRR